MTEQAVSAHSVTLCNVARPDPLSGRRAFMLILQVINTLCGRGFGHSRLHIRPLN